MQRTIIQPADISATGLADLKEWLGISRPGEDALLEGLLHSGLDMCEAFIGRVPLLAMIEERVHPHTGWHTLATQPVRRVVSVEKVASNGTRGALALEDFSVTIHASGGAAIAIPARLDADMLAVTFQAGIAADWETLPPALRQGIIRLSAQLYRERSRAESGTLSTPPASVVALWRPWRALRLA
ncbi:MAG: hypothetical protein WA918_01765 [Erythrobacter sp.]